NEPMEFDGPDGPVTQNEINSYISFSGQPSRMPTTALSNILADGGTGQDVESLGLIYEFSQNPQILDIMINFTDKFLSLRNDPENGRVMWTGKREFVWCTKAADADDAGYAGSEGLDTAGKIAYAAYLILKTPCLWEETVTDNDPYNYGKTYKERAIKYVTEMDKTIDTYYLKYFIHKNDSKIYNPNSSDWLTVKDLPPNSPMPWNRQQMMTNGFLRVAECHEILLKYGIGNSSDNKRRIDKYFTIIRVSIDWMVSEFRQKTTDDGIDVYYWSYKEGDKSAELINIHALYDIWGLYRAWQRNDKLQLDLKDVMTRMANTMRYVIYLGDNKISKRIDGTSSASDKTGNLYGPWVFYSEFIPDWYEIFINLSQNKMLTGPRYLGAILWTKNARARGKFPT
ncbi:317_t:CDS:1, partial [Cetraspora pellucida]